MDVIGMKLRYVYAKHKSAQSNRSYFLRDFNSKSVHLVFLNNFVYAGGVFSRL